jgi:DNA polymerase III epsilon subunit-like protein
MIRHWNTPWHQVPTVVVDTETTGTRPGIDRVVQFAAVRFERGQVVDEFESLVNPGIPIPAEATEIHGITDDMVAGAPTIEQALASMSCMTVLWCGPVQLAAYNADFDRDMLPPIGSDPRWPWLDPLVLVRDVDRYAKGKGRHQLGAACARHGIELTGAHGALADARAAGQLLYKLGAQAWRNVNLGAVLHWTMRVRANQWMDYHQWLSEQPPKEAT